MPNLGTKLDYLFGEATGEAYNINRSLAMLRNLNKIGIFDNAAGRALVRAHLGEALNYAEGFVQANGRVIKESILLGQGDF